MSILIRRDRYPLLLFRIPDLTKRSLSQIIPFMVADLVNLERLFQERVNLLSIV